jgi:large subunit ribosomal protein L29
MKVDEIREMDEAAILETISSTEKEIMGLRMKNTIGDNENPLLIRERKRDVARMKTVLREKSLNIR